MNSEVASNLASISMQSTQPASEQSLQQTLQSLLCRLECSDTSLDGVSNSLVESLRTTLHDSIRHRAADQRSQAFQEQALRRQMAQFAYGLTHEINNPLANIAARADLLLREIEDPRHQKLLRTILDSSMRAHEMLAEMMLSIQRPSINLSPMDIRKPLTDWFSQWSNRTQGRGLSFDLRISDDALWSSVDWGSLTEALIAGLRNSLDACRTGDTIQLVAERVEGDDKKELEIRIAIIDNGPGMSQDAQKHAWDVYYSGREAGRGLGIGLAKLRRIVEGHHGRVWLDSQANQGCSLEIRLPWYRRA